jgi:outer membrane receptor protein involved in Fe transport
MIIDPATPPAAVQSAPAVETQAVETVVVRAARLSPAPTDPVFSIVRLKAADLQASPRLDEALKAVPGASLFRRTSSLSANPTSQGLSLRAIAPSGAGRALVTLDGIPQNDPFGGWVIWTALPPEGLSGASVVRGAGAGAYGAGALTGVVALDEVAARSGFIADLSGGELGAGRLAVSASAGPLLLVGSRETSDGYVPVRGTRPGAADIKASLDTWSASARLQGDVAGAVAALRIGAYEEERGAGLRGANSRVEGQQASLTLVKDATDTAVGWRVQAWARQSDLANTSVAVATGRATTTPANNQYETPAKGYGVNAAMRWVREGWSAEVGADARLTDGEVHEKFRYLSGAFTRDRQAGGQTQVVGLYAEASRQVGGWLVAGGARIDSWSSSNGFRRERDVATGALTLNQTSADRDGLQPTARLGLRRAFGQDQWVRGAVYSGFRTPTLNELHRPFRVGNDITEANPGLKPERLAGLDLAVGGDQSWTWSLGGFFNRIDDPIANVTIGVGPGLFPTAGFVPAGGVLRQRQNAGRIEAFGLEADASSEVLPGLTLRGAVSATHARVNGGRSARQLNGKRPAQTPEVTVVASVRWTPVARLTVSGDLRLEGARFEDDLNVRRLGPSAGVDLKTNWRLAPGTELYLAADNVTDAQIAIGQTADGVDSYGAPRQIRIGLTLRR